MAGLRISSDPALLAGFLSDAASYPGGHSPRLVRPRTTAEVAAYLADSSEPVLAVGAQSSLTGGSTPFGETVLALAGLDALQLVGNRLRAGAGVLLCDLQARAAEAGFFYPPAPTFDGASIGGNAATNAGGSATFKYGTTRDWVQALTVVLADGQVLELERGQYQAQQGRLCLPLPDGSTRELAVPAYRNPPLKKISAGYHAADALDAIDLFVGSEGTLGVITEVEVGLAPRPIQTVVGLLVFTDEAQGFATVASLRAASQETWAAKDPRGIDVRAIESLDGPSLELLRAAGTAERLHIELPEAPALAILFECELTDALGEQAAIDLLEAVCEGRKVEACGMSALFQLLAARGQLEALQLALPGDRLRREQLYAFREALPMLVNELTAAAQRDCAAVHRLALDAIVPFDQLRGHLRVQREMLAGSGLHSQVWGHISDGNLHCNLRVYDEAQIALGKELLFAFASDAIERGGCPLAEHGTGRNPVKQQMLRSFRGVAGIRAMQRIKAALDPTWRLAPGVLFARPAT